MSGRIDYRPLSEEDLPAVHEVSSRAFADLDRRFGGDHPGTPQPPEAAIARLRRPMTTDPGGAWVAERDGAIVGCALAIVREGLWGLSLLCVDPSAQSEGAGRELLARAHAYGADARGWVVLASPDARALRAYARLGLAVHPCISAVGAPRRVEMPAGVRRGGPDDLPLTEAVDRSVRGAAHGEDITTMLDGGAQLLVAPDRGYAVVRDGHVRIIAAFDDDGARAALRAALAQAAVDGRPAFVEWISSAQQWAAEVCVDARLELRAVGGALFLGGDVGPFRPYLPSGAYL